MYLCAFSIKNTGDPIHGITLHLPTAYPGGA